MSEFDGKVAFVAGGSSGINLGIATRLGELGCRLALLSRTAEKVEAAAAALRQRGMDAIGIAADVRNYADVEQAFVQTAAKWGTVDIVISGAAGNFLAPVIGMSANAFKTVIDIDLLGTFNVLRASWSHLTKPGASLISITAGQAVNPMMFQAHACAAKAGINQLTRVLAMEWGPAGVRVNAISPGPIEGTEGMARLTPTPESEALLKSTIPLRRYGTKADIAEAVRFLCSDSAQYITGTILDCEGGSQLGDASADALTLP